MTTIWAVVTSHGDTERGIVALNLRIDSSFGICASRAAFDHAMDPMLRMGLGSYTMRKTK